MLSAVSRAVTMPPRTREKSFSKCSGSESFISSSLRPW